jgi:hypothetical protein
MLKTLLSILLLVVAPANWAAGNTAAAAVITGDVLEVMDVESYTYLRLKTKDGELWAAMGKAPVKVGATVTIEDVNIMNNFESKTLHRTFKSIAFGNLAGAGGHAPDPHGAHGSAHAGANAADTPDVQVSKAGGENAWTVAEINARAAELKEKPVLVRGKVVKYNPGIMGRNWVHLRDGSGSPADQTNDVLVTSLGEVKLGDIVTAKGVVRTDKDFGAGYSFKVLIEDVTFQQ